MEQKSGNLARAKQELKSEGFDVGHQKHGMESFHPKVGEFWMPEHLIVNGDMTKEENLRNLSRVLTKHNLEVKKQGPVGMCERTEDGHAKVVEK